MKRVNQILNHEVFKQSMEAIKEYEVARIFCGHDIEHLLSVARIMTISALENNMDINKEIIYATALLHDIGRSVQYSGGVHHCVAGPKLATEILEDVDFSEEEKSMIINAVGNHNNESKQDRLSELLKYADNASRNCFNCTAYDECNWNYERKNHEISI